MNNIFRALALVLLMVATAAPAAIYKYVDKSGEVHFTDKPVPGAHRVDLPQIQTYSAGNLPPPDIPLPGEEEGAQAAYKSVTMTRPQPKETFRGVQRSVTVSVRTEPALRPSDRIMFYLDDKPALPEPIGANATVLEVPGRGTHHVSAAVVGPEGKPLARSDAVEFYMKPPVARPLDNVPSASNP